ncbi:MAG: hypothetical protein ACKVJX_20260 [Verrucomicrobiia bacterium]|jgi:hypothetical protein
MPPETAISPADTARAVRDSLPKDGLFANMEWRTSTRPFSLGAKQAKEIEKLGRVFLQFYRAVNLLYRKSVEGKQPAWVAEWLERGKPAEMIELQRTRSLKNEMPRVIRPDLLLTDKGFSVTELDSVPGGIGLTAWLNQAYTRTGADVLGGAAGMLDGFAKIFGEAKEIHVMVSEESAAYRPEMDWIASQIQTRNIQVHDTEFQDFQEGDAVYRFFELFDLANVACSKKLFKLAIDGKIQLTPPPKTYFEEKMLFALLWNRNLAEFWRQELGGRFFETLKSITPYTWVVDPEPLPPHGAIPEINLTDWHQLKTLSQKQRDLILKVSGFSESAWGARGVYLGSDLSTEDWSQAVDDAIRSARQSPSVLQRFHKPKRVEAEWFDFEANETRIMPARARICPYYFVSGEGDQARAKLGGALATLCPADKKIIHGMTDAALAPCSA